MREFFRVKSSADNTTHDVYSAIEGINYIQAQLLNGPSGTTYSLERGVEYTNSDKTEWYSMISMTSTEKESKS